MCDCYDCNDYDCNEINLRDELATSVEGVLKGSHIAIRKDDARNIRKLLKKLEFSKVEDGPMGIAMCPLCNYPAPMHSPKCFFHNFPVYSILPEND